MKGDVLVISGLSGSGKSTLAEGLRAQLAERGRNVTVHDGDSLREFFGGALQYSAEDRLMVSKVLVYAAHALAEQGVDVILATMLSQPGARAFLEERVPFTEIHLSATFEDVSDKDVKGVYQQLNSGDAPNIVGHDLVLDAPENPDLLINTHMESPDVSLERIQSFLAERNIFGLGDNL